MTYFKLFNFASSAVRNLSLQKNRTLVHLPASVMSYGDRFYRIERCHVFLNRAVESPLCSLHERPVVYSCHRCRSRQNFLGAKDFCPNFLKLARKIFGPLFVRTFSQADLLSEWPPKSGPSFHMVVVPKTGPSYGCTDVGCHFFQIKPRCAPFLSRFSGIWQRFSQILPIFPRILPRFSEILPGFSPNQNFWGYACTPTSYTTDSCS